MSETILDNVTMLPTFLCVVFYVYTFTDAYILLQVRKNGEDKSTIDALIHKVVPSDKVNEVADNLADNHFNDKEFDIKKHSGELEGKVMVMTERKETKEIPMPVKEEPMFRSNSKLEFKPKVIHFRNKPALFLEVPSKSVVSALGDVLESRLVRKNVDSLSRKLALKFRSV